MLTGKDGKKRKKHIHAGILSQNGVNETAHDVANISNTVAFVLSACNITQHGCSAADNISIF